MHQLGARPLRFRRKGDQESGRIPLYAATLAAYSIATCTFFRSGRTRRQSLALPCRPPNPPARMRTHAHAGARPAGRQPRSPALDSFKAARYAGFAVLPDSKSASSLVRLPVNLPVAHSNRKHPAATSIDHSATFSGVSFMIE
jgi:hypothetical protein